MLDDDDEFKTPHALGEIQKLTQDPEDVIFWRVLFPGGVIIPNNKHWKKDPTCGQISGIGFCFNLHWRNTLGALWDCKCMGDYRLAKKLTENSKSIKFLDKILTGLARPNTGGHGKKDDLPSTLP
jgi:hypothetical protein